MARLISRKTGNLVFITLMAAALTAFLWQYSHTGATPTLNTGKREDTAADYFLHQAHIKRYNASGELTTEIRSPAIRHRPVSDSALLDHPEFQFYQQGMLSWQLNADRGEILQRGERLELEQQVRAVNRGEGLSLKTPALTVYPEKQQASTDLAVTLSSPQGFTRAIGLQIDLTEQQLLLQQQVRGYYEIQP